MIKSKVVYGDPENIHVFEMGSKFNTKIKTRRGEVVYSKEPYAQEMYDILCGKEDEYGYIPKPVKTGEIVNAKFASMDGDELLFDFGGKDYLRVDKSKRELNFIQGQDSDTSFRVLVTDVSDKPFLMKGSIAVLYEMQVHQELKNLDKKKPVEAHVIESTPAGYTLNILHNGVSIPGFMPNTLAGVNKLHDPESIVGETFHVMIESYSKEKGTYIVSRRKYLKTLIPQTIKSLEFDKVYSGHVTGTTPFGIFVEFEDCLTGMIHKTNINPEFQDRIQEIKPGTEIEFYVKEIIKNQKIILTQILRESMWDTIHPNQMIEGTVRSVKPFGVLVSLDDETNGLIHQSELAKLAKKNYSEKDDIKVKVLSVDRMTRKIFLTTA